MVHEFIAGMFYYMMNFLIILGTKTRLKNIQIFILIAIKQSHLNVSLTADLNTQDSMTNEQSDDHAERSKAAHQLLNGGTVFPKSRARMSGLDLRLRADGKICSPN